VQLLNAGFVCEGGILVGRGGFRFGGIFAAIAMHVVQVLRLRVIAFEVLVADRPFRGDSAVMLHLAEILRPHTQQRRAINF
jgi:hypothetical protein